MTTILLWTVPLTFVALLGSSLFVGSGGWRYLFGSALFTMGLVTALVSLIGLMMLFVRSVAAAGWPGWPT
jgi:hypothetical protein